jgi:hypothetical protein
MESYQLGKLLIQVEELDNHVKFYWTGSSDNVELYRPMQPWYMKQLADVRQREVVLDFLKLEFMNSSTVPAIIDWVKCYGLNGVKVTVLYEKASPWQRSSFRMLSTMSASIKNVTIEGI